MWIAQKSIHAVPVPSSVLAGEIYKLTLSIIFIKESEPCSQLSQILDTQVLMPYWRSLLIAGNSGGGRRAT